MTLIGKILYKHSNPNRLIGFLTAYIIGLSVIIVGIQLYRDISPAMDSKNGVFKPDFLIINKPVHTLGSLLGTKTCFSESEIADIANQDFITHLGQFTPARYHIVASLDISGFDLHLSTELFFESVPDYFIDVRSDSWTFKIGDKEVPIIIPQDYINLYNFGYAPSANMPTITESMIGKVRFELFLSGNGKQYRLKGRIIGLSNNINTILVPESFIEWSNQQFGHTGNDNISRLIVQVDNPTDTRIAQYFEQKELEISTNKLNESKTNRLLQIILAIVLIVGLLICSLACYILLLSIFLLLQENKLNIEKLLLLGYSTHSIAVQYYRLIAVVNIISYIVAVGFMLIIRHFYINQLGGFMQAADTPSIIPSCAILLAAITIATTINVLVVRKSISKLSK